MVWSYNLSLVNQYGKDFVRLLVGDTIVADPQVQDEEINAIMATRSTPYGAAADICRSLAARFSRSVDQTGGTSKVMYSQMAKAYNARALEFENQAAMAGAAAPYSGGTSVSDMQNNELNTDRVGPAFTMGMTDNYLPMAPTGPETEDAVSNPVANSP